MLKRLGIYIHIPFCLSKCRYCGFYSRGGADEGEMGRYAASLADDIKEYGKIYGKIPGRGREDPGYTVDTVFIGGGTPSILPPGAVSSLMDSLRSAFDIEADAEITIESNPKTLTREKLLEYRRAASTVCPWACSPLTTGACGPWDGSIRRRIFWKISDWPENAASTTSTST